MSPAGSRPQPASSVPAGPLAPPRPGLARHLLALSPAWLAAALIYRDALHTYFTADDIVSLLRAAGLQPTPLTFRPLSAVVAARAQYAAFGLEPLGYHAVNLALHLLNTAGVYALVRVLTGRSGLAQASAVLFAASAIAFTPLHWASGVGELLAGTLLLSATLLHVGGRLRGRAAWRWGASALAFLAVLAKETAVAWPLAIAALEGCGGLAPARPGRARGRLGHPLFPAAAMGVASIAWLALSRGAPTADPGDPYAVSGSPQHLALNLLTYLRWCVALGDPIRDRLATVDPEAWAAGLAAAAAFAAGMWLERREARRPLSIGVAWLLAFLVPVLPLAHHTYLYYLYIPWMGGALAFAALGASALGGLPRRILAAVALVVFATVEGRNVDLRRRSTVAGLPVDPTVREAMLLGNALPALRATALPPGTRVGFVNPVPGKGFDVVRGMPTRDEDRRSRRSYYPLEVAMMRGETLRLFTPGLEYAGFSESIPAGWDDVECFLFYQAGQLEHWGRGSEALQRQQEHVARKRAEADSTARP